MALVVTQEGALALWQQILDIGGGIGFPVLHLLGASYAPLHTSTLANFAANELAVAGYAPVSLINPTTDWSLTPIGAGNQAQYLLITFTFTAACTIYGYYLSDSADSVSLWGEEFSTPFVYGTLGGSFGIQLINWLASQPSVGGIPCP